MLEKKQKQQQRHKRVRAKVKGTREIPRLSVFRSNKFIYTQIIDDDKGKTILSANQSEIKKSEIPANSAIADGRNSKSKTNSKSKIQKNKTEGKIAIAYEIGKLTAKKALDKKIKKVVFDRGGYKYHGRVKAVAEGAREGGLDF